MNKALGSLSTPKSLPRGVDGAGSAPAPQGWVWERPRAGVGDQGVKQGGVWDRTSEEPQELRQKVGKAQDLLLSGCPGV